MAADSAIEWTDHTFNPWWGCQKVSPGCEHCYAETLSNRFGKDIWGPPGHTDRRLFGDKHWAEPEKWNRKAEREGRRARVFCASMADVFEQHPQVVDARARLFDLIERTPWLDWQLLTKRPENVRGMVPWEPGEWPTNLWLGTSVEDQRRADERVPVLLDNFAACYFISAEPLLGPVDLSQWMCSCTRDWEHGHSLECRGAWEPMIGWVIVGGESGPGARPMHPKWARDLRDQCVKADVPFLFKQWGAWAHTGATPGGDAPPHVFDDGAIVWRVGKKAAGRDLDGRTWDEFPTGVLA